METAADFQIRYVQDRSPVTAKTLKVGNLEICCGFHAALLIWGDAKSLEDCEPVVLGVLPRIL